MKIGFIGTGNMGGAILKGYAKSSASAGNDILIHNKLSEHNSVMAEAMAESGNTYKSIRICNDNIELAEEADIIIIGVKPSSVDEVLSQIAPCLAMSPGKIVVSMAAGVSIASMEAMLNEAKPGCSSSAKLIRIMPNINASVLAAVSSTAIRCRCTSVCRLLSISASVTRAASTKRTSRRWMAPGTMYGWRRITATGGDPRKRRSV